MKSNIKQDSDDPIDTVTIEAKDEEEHSTQDLTDEQLARKLQTEWHRQDRLQSSQEPVTTERVAELPVAAKSIALIAEESKRPTIEDPSSTCIDNIPIANLEESLRQGSAIDSKATLSLQSSTAQEDTLSYTMPFDESPLTFLPSRYLPELKKHWAAEGGDASYALLTRCFILVNSTQSRIKIVDTLVNFLRTIIEGDPESLLPTVSAQRSK